MTKRTLILDCEVCLDYFLLVLLDYETDKIWVLELKGDEVISDDMLTRLSNLLSNNLTIGFNSNRYDNLIIQKLLQGGSPKDLYELSTHIIFGDTPSWMIKNDLGYHHVVNTMDHIDVFEVATYLKVSLKMIGARMHTKTMSDVLVSEDFGKVSSTQKIYLQNLIKKLRKKDLPELLERGFPEELCDKIRIRKEDITEAEAKLINEYIGDNFLITDNKVVNCNNHISEEDIIILREYCRNDVSVTKELYDNIIELIKLRESLSSAYNMDLRSCGVAKIAERVMRAEIEKLADEYVSKPVHDFDKDITYVAPKYIREHIKGANLTYLLDKLEASVFKRNKGGHITIPKWLEDEVITIGDNAYNIGIGGLHSRDKDLCVRSEEGESVLHADVTSYYPSLILNSGKYPGHLGISFINVYSNLVDKRLEAKRSGNAIDSEALKIVINGVYGKFSDKYSIMYAPELMLYITLTGQLSLLILIAMLEQSQVRVVSANTDGIYIKIENELLDRYGNIGNNYDKCVKILEKFQDLSSLNLDIKEYKSLHSRDVNAYVAINGDGHSGISLFRPNSLNTNPQGEIVAEAVINKLKYDTPLENTIKGCEDIKKFIYVKRVSGGGVWQGKYLGKVARWVNTTNGSAIRSANKGHKVGGADKATPIITLEGMIPDIDYDRYIEEANKLYEKIS